MTKTVIVTGGAGFIGSEVVRQFISETDYTVVNVDKLTYAGDLESLREVLGHPRHYFEQVDICDCTELKRIFSQYQPEAVMHLAAESHVDRSIELPEVFIQSNIVGTFSLLEVSRKYWSEMAEENKKHFRFHHVSTDEVYGSLAETGNFTEDSAYSPNSPYSASKASSNHLVRAWHQTYGLPVVTSNCTNNYGPYQNPEKLIPKVILNALTGKSIPIYGKGDQIRDWLYVEDHVRALRLVMEKGNVGEVYNIGGNNEKTNLEVVKMICEHLDNIIPNRHGTISKYEDLITFVEDRPGHDQRYAIDTSKIQCELGWVPNESFDSGIIKIIYWYLLNPLWAGPDTGEDDRGKDPYLYLSNVSSQVARVN